MRKWLVAHGRLLYWLWCLAAVLFLWNYGRSGAAGGAFLKMFCGFLIWCWVGLLGGNMLTWRLCRPAIKTVDEDCDPEPLLELCQSVIRQNPKTLIYRVYGGWALSLLGRGEEAEREIALAEKDSRLWNNVGLLVLWSACLPQEDSRRARAEEVLSGLAPRLNGRRKEMLEQELEFRRDMGLLPQAPDGLEQRLLGWLERADCTRMRVGVHLALGTYYAQRLDPAAGEHLSFVLAHGNKLCARSQAERLLCALPGGDGRLNHVTQGEWE